jgi:hypothetical protein
MGSALHVTHKRTRAADRIGKLELTAALHVHERFDGRGAAYNGDRLLAEVDYSLKDVQEELDTIVQLGDSPVRRSGQRNIYGALRVNPADADALAAFVGLPLMLRLEDGRHLPFTVAKVMRMNRFLIQALGDVH